MFHRFLMAGAVAAGLFTLSPARAAEPAGHGALDRKAVESIVREYILANPEIIAEAILALQEKEEAQARQAVVDAVRANRAELFNSATTPVLGNPKGDVTLVEFFDYNCGYCKAAHPERTAAVEADGKVRLVLKEFPILSPSSVEAARAALAAHLQGRYAPMHEGLIAHKGALDTAAIDRIARAAGVDVERMRKDMESPTVTREIEANRALAQALGIRGTPGFVVGEQVVPGAIDKDAFATLFAAQRSDAKGG